MAVLVGNHLALLGELHLAVQHAVGLAEDRGVGGAATPANGAAAPVEYPDWDACLVGDLPDGPQGLVDLPLRCGDATVLVGVRVADHDLLGAAAQVHDPPVGIDGEQCPEGRAD